MAGTQPAAYCKLLGLLIPKEHKVEHANVVGELSDERLDEMIAELEERIAARAAGAEVIEGVMMQPPALPAPTPAASPSRRNSRNRADHHERCQPCPTNRGGSLYGCEMKNKGAGQTLPTPDQPLHSPGRWRAEAIWKPKHTTPIFTEA
jgi:hypothetical protein